MPARKALFMRSPKVSRKSWSRVAPGLLGLLLLAYLVRRVGPSRLLEGIASVGWGLVLVIALAGLSHVVRAWAWRLTLLDAGHRVAFGRMFALRLASEAAGQIGVFGQVFGDTWRVARLGVRVPLEARITSVALDRMLFTLSSTVVTFVGIVSVIFLLPLPAKFALYAKIFGLVLVAIVCLVVVAVHRRWAVISGPAGALGSLGKIGRWLESKRETIRSVENSLLDFFHHSPTAFREAFTLYMVGQAAAVMEVYLILRLMGYHAGFTSALAIEGLTKLVNVIGMINPGNAGTYEGGNMLLARLAGVGATAGLTLGLIRRVRALFWAAAGASCAVTLSGPARSQKPELRNTADPDKHGGAAVILAQGVPAESVLMRVGALPVLLRAVLGAQKAGASRIVVVIEPAARMRVNEELRRTRRLPGNIEWREPAGDDIAPVLRDIAVCEARVVLIAADRTYHPALHRRAAEWEKSEALALTSDGRPVGIYAFTTPRATSLLKQCPARTRTLDDLHEWLARAEGVICESVPSDQWQRVSSAEDRIVAEQKLDRWLVKPTDGVFARMNRKVSIPISRRLIQFPITPNMVSLFTLGVSFLAGALFALGGRGNMLLGAILSVFASILDGSDGEVARLKLQESAFGCWLETVCDYLYYVFIFAGMMIGLLGRGPIYLVWGTMLFFGAVASFFTTALQRHRMAAARPEQYLSLWQAQASRRRSNPFLCLGRHAEFMIRRCCLPYLVLAFALFGATYMAFIGAAVGANIVWPIALYSYFTFEPVSNAS
jgi:phosphatidylglycerophosphate synthase